MTSLEAEIRQRVQERGPLGVGEYMGLCLGHPTHGYYMAREPFGRAGDFVTAPEISQMFGELLGAWAADSWMRMGSPAPVRLVELGPGRGTLMADALRALSRVPGFVSSATLHLVETSPRLREAQRETLREGPLAPVWHETLEAVPEGPALVIANEFFDALPVEQWVRVEAGWRRRMVMVRGDHLAFGASEEPAPAGTFLPDAPLGSVLETAPARLAVARALGARIASAGGAALVIDYGHAQSGPGETLQAVRAHSYTSPLQDPGLADLTAHVDFEALARAVTAAGAQAYGPMEQGSFLRALGLDERAARLKRQAGEAQAREIDAARARLAEGHAMGSLFKVLAIGSPGLVPVPFTAAAKDLQHA